MPSSKYTTKRRKLICVSSLLLPFRYFFSFNWYQSYKIKACFQSCLLEIERSRRERDQKMRQESSDRSQNTGAIEGDASHEVSVQIQEKEGSVTIKYPMLTKCNYATWAIKMEVFMRHKVFGRQLSHPKQ